MMHIDETIALVPLPKDGDSQIVEFKKRNTKRVGIVSELVAMQRFAAAGYFIYIPFGDNAPSDLVVEDRHGETYRIQVKTGRLRNGVVLFNCCSFHGHRGRPATGYVGKVDAFAIYCPNNDELYVVPIDAPAATAAKGGLRIASPSNGMKSKIHWARDYRFNPLNPIARIPR
ncbi:MAG: hypothetical protein JO359_00160 [Candidatus Eremiobacteraeota bacterium]|nr:hypothetical protein [Candidatus Eremiobacteraeota bacterium]